MTTGLSPRKAVEVGGVAFDTVMAGDGPVTVVFVNGLGAPLEEWALVAPVIAEHCRVVCYDRRLATAKGAAHHAAQVADDLQQLLATLGVSGPLLLVGHSWGGALIRRFRWEHPDHVVGMVYVDATHENIKGMHPTRFSRVLYAASTFPLRAGVIRRRLLHSLGFENLSPELQAEVDNMTWIADGRTALAEYAGIGPSLTELAEIAPDLPPVPTQVLLAAGRPGLLTKLAGKQLAAIRKVWEQAVSGRDDITLQVVADSGHYISLDQPEAVITAINDVLSRAQRKG
ncbi:MAG TPA: alpha/beta hydrolase [Mycobacteriales bacterium]|nr:alpha/beta hydrolase [Mycobacteriales bacterium]